MLKNKTDLLEMRLINFAVRVVAFAEKIPPTDFGRKMCNQLSRSAVTPAQMFGEARSAESGRDYVHKMKVGLKELRETLNSLRLVDGYNQLKKKGEDTELVYLIDECDQLVSILVVSIATAKRRLESNK